MRVIAVAFILALVISVGIVYVVHLETEWECSLIDEETRRLLDRE